MPSAPVRISVIVDESDLALIDKLCTKPDFDCGTLVVRRADVIRQAVVFYLGHIRCKGVNEFSETFVCEKCAKGKPIGMGQPLRDRRMNGTLGLVCFRCAE